MYNFIVRVSQCGNGDSPAAETNFLGFMHVCSVVGSVSTSAGSTGSVWTSGVVASGCSVVGSVAT